MGHMAIRSLYHEVMVSEAAMEFPPHPAPGGASLSRFIFTIVLNPIYDFH